MAGTDGYAMIEMADAVLDYGGAAVLDGLSLSVAAGEVYALLGGNGAGKSTTLSVLLGFARTRAGRVAVDGVDPAADPDGARRRTAFLPENVALYDHLSGTENATICCRWQTMPGPAPTSPTRSPPPGCRKRPGAGGWADIRRGCARRSR